MKKIFISINTVIFMLCVIVIFPCRLSLAEDKIERHLQKMYYPGDDPSERDIDTNDTQDSKERTTGMVPCKWVFKTRGDYLDLISVLLNEDKTNIVMYPVLYVKKLDQGYLYAKWACSLPERGHLAYSSVKFEEWDKCLNSCKGESVNGVSLERSKKGTIECDCFLSKDVLLKNIIDDNPLTELYFCRKIFSSEKEWKKIEKEYIKPNETLTWQELRELKEKIIMHKLNEIINNGELDEICEKK